MVGAGVVRVVAAGGGPGNTSSVSDPTRRHAHGLDVVAPGRATRMEGSAGARVVRWHCPGALVGVPVAILPAAFGAAVR